MSMLIIVIMLVYYSFWVFVLKIDKFGRSNIFYLSFIFELLINYGMVFEVFMGWKRVKIFEMVIMVSFEGEDEVYLKGGYFFRKRICIDYV